MKNSLIPLTNKKQASKRYKAWFNQGLYDLQAANLSLENGFNEWAAYQAQQAVEKALKAVLVHAGWRAPRMHKLPVLLGMSNQVNKEVAKTKFEYRHLESFTFISRYPFLLPGNNKAPHEIISKDDASLAVDQAQTFLDKLKTILQHEAELPADKQVFEEVYTKTEIDERLEQIKQILIDAFEPERILLFGSFARKREQPKKGTMDILIIANTDLSFIDRIKKARMATRGQMPIIEPIVYTPDEFQYMKDEEGEGFIEAALEEGIEIYSKVAS